MSVRLFSASIVGIDAQQIEVQVDSTPGLHTFSIVGLPDKSLAESKDRIGAAIRNSGFLPPQSKNKRIIINLAPADVKKEGSSYDLPIALGYLLETKQLSFEPHDKVFLGELSLDGSVRSVSGVLASALWAKKAGFQELIIPFQNIQEALVVEGLRVTGVRTLQEVIGHLNGTIRLPVPTLQTKQDGPTGDSFLYIQGQETAKRALIIAAAGSHNILMNGAPGSGKTLLAKAFSELLPPLSLEEAIEVAKIYSSLGLLHDTPLSFQAPFRNPHHTTSAAAVVGGGTSPQAGEISLAHRGVLFLDELPEFNRAVLESLRQPLEEGTVTISRAAGTIRLPAKFTLVAAMNPCPCGNYGDPTMACICAPINVIRYQKKISGPLLDRLDIQVSVPRESVKNTTQTVTIDALESIRTKIQNARDLQYNRLKSHGIRTNSEISHKHVQKVCNLTGTADKLLKQAANTQHLSLRTYHKLHKLARTVADLDDSEQVQERHVAEAMSLRIQDKTIS